MFGVFFFIFGTLWGSFFNVCISRIPRGKSIAFPPSHCPECEARIRWYDNIPLLSYIILRRKCRSCKAPISLQYPFVELLTGLIFLFLYLEHGLSFEFAFYLVISGFLIIGAMIDLRYFILPEITTIVPLILTIVIALVFDLTGLQLTLLLAQEQLLSEYFTLTIPMLPQFMLSLAGAILGFSSFWGLAKLGKIMFRKDALGGGDIILMGFIGSLTGPIGVFIVTLLGSFVGSIIGLIAMTLKVRKKPSEEEHIWQEEDFSFTEEGYYLPFGPFLAFGTLVTLIWGVYFIFALFGMYHL